MIFKKLSLVLYGNIFIGLILPTILVFFVVHSDRPGIQGYENLIVLAVLFLAGTPKALKSLTTEAHKISFDTDQELILMKSLFSTRKLHKNNVDSFVFELRIKNRDPWLKIRWLQGKEIQLRVGDWREQIQAPEGYNHWTHILSFLRAFIACIGIEKLHGTEELERLTRTIATEKTDSGFDCHIPEKSKKLIAELKKTLEKK